MDVTEIQNLLCGKALWVEVSGGQLGGAQPRGVKDSNLLRSPLFVKDQILFDNLHLD